MINIISKKKKTTKKNKASSLQKLQNQFEELGLGLIQDIYENFGCDYELA